MPDSLADGITGYAGLLIRLDYGMCEIAKERLQDVQDYKYLAYPSLRRAFESLVISSKASTNFIL